TLVDGGATATASSVPGSSTLFNVTFGGTLANQNVPQMTVASNNEVQQLTFSGTPITGGSFQLIQAANPASPVTIQWDSTTAILQARIQNGMDALVGAGNTIVTSPSAGVYSITYTGPLANQDVPAFITATNSETQRLTFTTTPVQNR